MTECTGIAAQWCPIHGTCRCPARENELNGPDCPLHGEASDHPREPGQVEGQEAMW